jgi:hypothetical protein
MEALIHSDSLATKIGLTIGVVALLALANHFFTVLSNARALSKYPIANEKWDAEAKKKFTESASEILDRGIALVLAISKIKI